MTNTRTAMNNTIFIDKVTKRPIHYAEDSIFVLAVKGGYKKKRIIKYFKSKEIEQAFTSFYDLEIPKNQKKYLYQVSESSMDIKSGELIYRMNGYLSNGKSYNFRTGIKAHSYRRIPTINLIHTPESLAKKMDLLDLDSFPITSERWSKTKISYCLWCFFLALDKKKQCDLLEKAFNLLILEKLESGGVKEEVNEMKELIKTKPDLSELL